MDSDFKLIAENPFFDGIGESYLKGIASNTIRQTFKAGDFVHHEGDDATKFFLVLQGKINILTDNVDVNNPDAPELIAIQTLGPRDILGWSWFILPYRWRFDAQAVEDTQLLAIDGKYLRDTCEKDQTLGYQLLKRLAHIMSDRLLATMRQLAMHRGQPFTQCEGG